MPAIASLEDLKAAQKDLLEAKDLEELKQVFKKWRRIGWKNVCKLWLQERTPEQLKGEGWERIDEFYFKVDTRSKIKEERSQFKSYIFVWFWYFKSSGNAIG